jgi:hypothetical protein
MVETAKSWHTLVYLLIILHSIQGHEVTISPDQVTNLRASRPDKPNTLFTEQARCVVSLTDGKFVTVKETCAEIRLLIEQQRK